MDNGIDAKEDLSDIYVSEETWNEVCNGRTFVLRELSATEFGDMAVKSVQGDDVNSVEYAIKMVDLCVVEPKGLQAVKLKPSILFELVQKIQDKMGISDIAQKNLKSALPLK